MTSTDLTSLEPLPIPFGTKADGTQYTWPVGQPWPLFLGLPVEGRRAAHRGDHVRQ